MLVLLYTPLHVQELKVIPIIQICILQMNKLNQAEYIKSKSFLYPFSSNFPLLGEKFGVHLSTSFFMCLHKYLGVFFPSKVIILYLCSATCLILLVNLRTHFTNHLRVVNTTYLIILNYCILFHKIDILLRLLKMFQLIDVQLGCLRFV